jgi:hypothetical protein
MRAKTVGFAISEKDRELLDRLSEHYGNGNRSEFLRLAMKRMEHERIAQRFIETRKQINEELGGRVLTSEEVLEAIKAATAN